MIPAFGMTSVVHKKGYPARCVLYVGYANFGMGCTCYPRHSHPPRQLSSIDRVTVQEALHICNIMFRLLWGVPPCVSMFDYRNARLCPSLTMRFDVFM